MSTVRTSQKVVDPIFLTVPEAITALRIGRTVLYELLSAGTIRSVTVGRRRLVDFASAQQWAAGLNSGDLKSSTNH